LPPGCCGRGYVQLTWLANYLAIGRALGLGEQLAIEPDQVLRPALAYRILSHGLRHGSFCGGRHTLASFIQGAACDYVQARRLVDRLDKAVEIAANAALLEDLLRVASA